MYPLDHLSYKNEKSITKKDVHQDPSLFRISPVIILNTFICLFLMIFWVCLWFLRYSTFVENLVSILRTLSEYAVVWEFSLLYIIDCSLFFIVFFFFFSQLSNPITTSRDCLILFWVTFFFFWHRLVSTDNNKRYFTANAWRDFVLHRRYSNDLLSKELVWSLCKWFHHDPSLF